MIQPFEATEGSKASSTAVAYYQIVPWENVLPAFAPLLMVKTVLLSPSAVKKFNRLIVKFSRLIEFTIGLAFVLRFATFIVPASAGRILAPIAALLHIPPIIIFTSGMRTQYMKIILYTFDFCFLQVANTLWTITFSAVLRDTRAILVTICWVNFSNSLLQETHLRNTVFMVVVTLGEWLFFVMLLVWLSLDLVDEVNHYALISACGRTLSTKDILTNVIGTMAMLSLRNLYRRYQITKHQKRRSGTAIQALGYRSKITLRLTNPANASVDNNSTRQATQINPTYSSVSSSSSTPPLQMYLATETGRFDPRQTVWPRIGALTRLSAWQIVVLYACGVSGGSLGVLSLFLPKNTLGAQVVAVLGLVSSALFSGVYTCCCQRQLLKRVASSFHFLFFWIQIMVTGVCVMDIFRWQWVSVCGVSSGLLLSTMILIVDALTPVMKQRLGFSYCVLVNGIVLFLIVMILLLLDLLVLGNWDLQDRVFLRIRVLGLGEQFHVAPFLLGRVLTVLIWSGRFVYVALTRLNDNAFILMRGNVEFDFESWKKQASPEVRRK